MSKISIAPDDWVVVCDGRKWLILENKGDADFLNLVIREERRGDNPPTREQGTDRPGRTHFSAGGVRGIVLVAPPRALGMIRPQLSAAVAKLVRGEVDKDYVGMPVDQIEKRLGG